MYRRCGVDMSKDLLTEVTLLLPVIVSHWCPSMHSFGDALHIRRGPRFSRDTARMQVAKMDPAVRERAEAAIEEIEEEVIKKPFLSAKSSPCSKLLDKMQSSKQLKVDPAADADHPPLRCASGTADDAADAWSARACKVDQGERDTSSRRVPQHGSVRRSAFEQVMGTSAVWSAAAFAAHREGYAASPRTKARSCGFDPHCIAVGR